jgi:riboflavin synthase
MTVVGIGQENGGTWFAVDAAAETLRITTVGRWRHGTRINLERALKVGDELGGHIVTGHVDGIGTVKDVHEEGGSHRVTIAAGPEIAPYVAPKGSITVDGVSLTVNDVRDTQDGVEFMLNIIPHTAAVTTFGDLKPGQAVNLEIDVLARYLQRMEALRAKS